MATYAIIELENQSHAISEGTRLRGNGAYRPNMSFTTMRIKSVRAAVHAALAQGLARSGNREASARSRRSQ